MPRTTESIWWQGARGRATDPLKEDVRTDVCVIGAGIAGLTTAYLLARAGRRAVVVDSHTMGSGETGRTSAHLSSALDDGFRLLARLHGPNGARMARASHEAAIDLIQHIVSEEGIDCEFERVDGYLLLPPNGSLELLEAELEAAREAGCDEAEWCLQFPVPGVGGGPAIRFPEQAQFHPIAYLHGLARAFTRRGGAIWENTHVVGVDPGPPARIVTGTGPVITADHVVSATNTPVIEWAGMQNRQVACRTYVVAMRIAPGAVPPGLYWDLAEPYHYVRRFGDLLLVGGEDHRTGEIEDESVDRFHRLGEWAQARFPVDGIQAKWSGQVLEPVDGLGHIGRYPGRHQHLYMITGDSGHGLTHGTLGGRLVTDLIRGTTNPWAPLYDPARVTLRAAGEYLKANLATVRHLTDRMTPGEVASPAGIPRGAGAVIRRGLAKVAVYRDEADVLHEHSAVCPHLGCVVHWNPVEHTWDCPCHGSRFTPDGQVINGPATRGLAEVATRRLVHPPAPS